MKKILLAIPILIAGLKAHPQPSLGGSVIYTRTTNYNFQSTGNDEWDAYAKTLPKEGVFEKNLIFTSESSLYNEAFSSEANLPTEHQKALFFVNFGKAPQPILKQLFLDFKKEKSTALLEFMTRDFLVENHLESRGWKLQAERKKIGEYVCMKALASMDGDEVTAWFAPEIPVPAGPAEYHGLPGLVLAVERLGETIFLATSVDLHMPDPELLIAPMAGKRLSQKELDRIVEEKTEEFNRTGPSKTKYNQK
jgi:GLPGLI family protein